ncbi:MAG: hypothetical protein M3Z09_05570 [Acidobacteriota bacterium]|nr:hypothetical protein [Acidobacteriota bacterium]
MARFLHTSDLRSAYLDRSTRDAAVIDAHLFTPTDWNGNAGSDMAWSAPTGYYGSGTGARRGRNREPPEEKAALINRQMEHFQPESAFFRNFCREIV